MRLPRGFTSRAGGERTYLKRLLEHFGDTPLSRIDQAAIDRAAIELYPLGTSATRNRSVYTPISAVLKASDVVISLRRPRGSSGNKATAWLWPEQAEALFTEAEKLNKDFAALLIVLCYTGMRLSEALGLTWNDVRLSDGYAYLAKTKNDEPRPVFLPPVAMAALGNMPDGRHHRVFRFAKGGHLYSLLKACAFRAGVDLYQEWFCNMSGIDAVLCNFELCRKCRPAEDDTGCWGECIRCGKRYGFVSRETLRSYIDREMRRTALTSPNDPPSISSGTPTPPGCADTPVGLSVDSVHSTFQNFQESELCPFHCRCQEAAARVAELEVAAQAAEAVMSIVEPRSDKAEYLRVLWQIRAVLMRGGREVRERKLSSPAAPHFSSDRQ